MMKASIALLPAAGLFGLASPASSESPVPSPSPCFSTALGGWGPEVVGMDILPLEDGTFAVSAIAMTQFSFGDPWVVVLDAAGRFLWREAAGEAGLPVSRDLESGGLLGSTGDGVLLLAAYGEPRATGVDADAAVLRIVPGRGFERATVLGGDDEGVYSILAMRVRADGSFLLACSDCIGSGATFFSSFDSDGDLEWRLDSALGEGEVRAVGESGEGFVILFLDKTDWVERLLFIDGTGNLRTGPEVCIDPDVNIRSMIADGDRILLGGSLHLAPWTACLDQSGVPVWQRTLTDYRGVVSDMAVSRDGSLTVCGFTTEQDGRTLAGLCRLDAGGEMEWSRRFGGGEFQCFESVSPLADGGMVLAGSIGVRMDDSIIPCAWVLRTSADGTVPGYYPDGDYFIPETLFEPVILNPLGWVIACGAFRDESEATARSEELRSETGIDAGTLWIPDWPSLSGTDAWLSYLGPVYPHDPRIVENLEVIETCSPDAYLIWAGGSSTRVTMTLEEAASPLP